MYKYYSREISLLKLSWQLDQLFALDRRLCYDLKLPSLEIFLNWKPLDNISNLQTAWGKNREYRNLYIVSYLEYFKFATISSFNMWRFMSKAVGDVMDKPKLTYWLMALIIFIRSDNHNCIWINVIFFHITAATNIDPNISNHPSTSVWMHAFRHFWL